MSESTEEERGGKPMRQNVTWWNWVEGAWLSSVAFFQLHFSLKLFKIKTWGKIAEMKHAFFKKEYWGLTERFRTTDHKD